MIQNNRLYVGLLIITVFVLNAILFSIDYQWDLTSDQRYTVSDAARKMIRKGKGEIIVTVLLHGNLPADLHAYRDFIDHYLFELRRIRQGVTVVYKNPNEGSLEDVNAFRSFLNSRGIKPISRRVATNEEVSSSLIYPYLSVHNNRGITFIDLLSSSSLNQESQGVLNSISDFESRLVKAIRDIDMDADKKVLVGGSESEKLVKALKNDSKEFSAYQFHPWLPESGALTQDSISGLVLIDRGYNLGREHLLLADQLLMRGIPVLWLVDKFAASVDSIRRYDRFMALPVQNMSEDFLFRSGVRTSSDLLMDLQSTAIPQVVGEVAGESRIIPVPFPYHPVVADDSQKSIIRFTGPLSLFFVSPLDTIRTARALSKRILITSSPYTQVMPSPVSLSFDFLRVQADPNDYNAGEQILAVMVEGSYESYFKNRLTSSDKVFLHNLDMDFIPDKGSSRQIIIADTDFALPFEAPDGQLLPLGYNIWERRMFIGNRNLLAESLELLIHGEEIPSLVKTDLSMKTLDTNKFNTASYRYLLTVIGVPILLIFVLSIVYKYYRRYRYENLSFP